MGWTRLVSVELTDEEKLDAIRPPGIENQPDYPYGLRISLNEQTLKKLDLEADCEIGDYIDLRALARVTSVSLGDHPDRGKTCCIELQIEQLAVESETDEDTRPRR